MTFITPAASDLTGLLFAFEEPRSGYSGHRDWQRQVRRRVGILDIRTSQ